MAVDLRANTAVDVLIGPFVDSTDGNTDETGLTLSQADIRLSKNGQNMAQKNDANAATHDELGYYNCPLDATDTNTEGTLDLCVHESGALPVHHVYNILAEAAWDSLYVAKDDGFMDVNVKAVSEDTTAADNAEAFFDGTGYAGTNNVIPTVTTVNGFAANSITATAIASNAITSAKIATDAIGAAQIAANAIGSSELAQAAADKVWATAARTLTAATNITSTGGTTFTQTGDAFLRIGAAGASLSAVPWNASWDAEVQSECADALTAYDPPTKAELDTAVADVSVDEIQATALADLFNTDSGTTYAAAIAGSVVKEIADNAGGSALSEAGIADAVWNEAQADHVAAGSFGLIASEVADILADTNELQTDDVPGLIAALNDPTAATIADAVWDEAQADHVAVGSFGITASEIADILTDTNELQTDDIPTLIAALPTAVEIQAEMEENGASILDTIRDKLPTNYIMGSSDQTDKDDDIDAILVDTGTTIPGTITTMQGNVTDILTDTGTTIPGTITTLQGNVTDILADTGELQTDDIPGTLATIDGKIDTISGNVDSVLADTGTDGVVVAGTLDVNAVQISGSATAANNLEASALGIVSAAAAAGTLSTTQMTTNLSEATNDHYNGRIVIWTSGVLAGQGTDITDYDGATKMLTYTAVTEAPGDGDTFVIV